MYPITPYTFIFGNFFKKNKIRGLTIKVNIYGNKKNTTRIKINNKDKIYIPSWE